MTGPEVWLVTMGSVCWLMLLTYLLGRLLLRVVHEIVLYRRMRDVSKDVPDKPTEGRNE